MNAGLSPEISIVVPIYNEEPNLQVLIELMAARRLSVL